MAGNPGPGGWAAVMMYENKKVSLSKNVSLEVKTNNKMELKAVINGLKMLKISCKVILHTDILYINVVNDRGRGTLLYSWKF